MKRFLKPILVLTLLLGLLAGVLCGCNYQKKILGTVMEVIPLEDGNSFEVIVSLDNGNKNAVLFTPNESSFFGLENLGVTEIDSLAQRNARVIIWCKGSAGKLKDGAGEKLKTYEASAIYVQNVLWENAKTLPDGTVLDERESIVEHSFLLKDGTELLREAKPTELSNITNVHGSLQMLPQKAQDQILLFYTRRGLLYNLDEELQKVYSAYCSSDPETFQGWRLDQTVLPIASGRDVSYFMTSLELPLVGPTGTGEAFDSKTGESIPNQELFRVSEAEAAEAILSAVGDESSVLREEMKAAFQFENLIFFPEQLEIYFPHGSIPSVEGLYITTIPYDKIAGVLKDGVIPENEIMDS